jgi:hypothetical protein
LSCAGPGFLTGRSSTMLRAPLWPSRSCWRPIRASRLRPRPGSSLLLSGATRILPNENAPSNLKSLPIGYEVPIVPERGYADVSKGKLVASADRRLEHPGAAKDGGSPISHGGHQHHACAESLDNAG